MVAAAELALALLIFVLVNFLHVIPFSETPWILLLGWLSLRARGRGWRSLGLVKPASWRQTLLVAAATAVVLQVLSIFVIEPVVTRISGQPLDLSRFAPLVGNVKLALVGLAVVWTLAAFGEELAYRGFVLNRAADLGQGSARAWAIALVAISVLFGLGHISQGPVGVVDSTVSGLAFGGVYLALGRNLWAPILAHGLTDTAAVLLVFLDLVPAVHR